MNGWSSVAWAGTPTAALPTRRRRSRSRPAWQRGADDDGRWHGVQDASLATGRPRGASSPHLEARRQIGRSLGGQLQSTGRRAPDTARRRPASVAPRTRIRSTCVARPASRPQSLVIFRWAWTSSSAMPGQDVALRGGGGLPDALREVVPVRQVPPAILHHVADHEHRDAVVGQGRPEVVEHRAQELEVRRAVVGVVERGVDRLRVEAEEPRPEPVVVAVLHDPQVRRRGQDEAHAVRQAAGPERRGGARARVARVAEERDPASRGAAGRGTGGSAWRRAGRTRPAPAS